MEAERRRRRALEFDGVPPPAAGKVGHLGFVPVVARRRPRRASIFSPARTAGGEAGHLALKPVIAPRQPRRSMVVTEQLAKSPAAAQPPILALKPVTPFRRPRKATLSIEQLAKVPAQPPLVPLRPFFPGKRPRRAIVVPEILGKTPAAPQPPLLRFVAARRAERVRRAQVSSGQIPPAVQALTLREAVVAWLNSLSALTAVVGTRIYFEDPSQMGLYPCVTVQVTDRSWGRNLAGADGTSTATVEIDGLALSESTCIAIAEVVRNNFDGFRGLQSGVPILWQKYLDESDETTEPPDGSDQWVYHAIIKYRIRHRVPFPTSVTQTNV